ncbi:hypothetical protein ROLI_013160 [Roseobacter fucihabitans]|uniref:Uncharacterized protein n=1 Tax=Roseobacter fucihabitans TaxID=1537242 RepID=A0ABZ2BSR1_9RHOB|nr:hypothetical protein [Roseobacter litoralis]MBC6968123.1 hypothetical protein [Roseobacter litoralis]
MEKRVAEYAHAYARNERFDAMRAEKIIRDIYIAIRGQSMNQTREGLKAAEDNLPDIARTRALECAESIGGLIQKAPTQPFYKAYDRAAVTLAGEFGITQVGAKELMKDVFEQHNGKELYAHGKQLEEQFHVPVREAARNARKAEQQPSHSQMQSRG